jgi:hypothetical protein
LIGRLKAKLRLEVSRLIGEGSGSVQLIKFAFMKTGPDSTHRQDPNVLANPESCPVSSKEMRKILIQEEIENLMVFAAEWQQNLDQYIFLNEPV